MSNKYLKKKIEVKFLEMFTIQTQYIIFCIFNIIEMAIFVIYTKIEIRYYEIQGIRKPNIFVYNILAFFFNNLVGFLSISFALLTDNYTAFILYFYWSINVLSFAFVFSMYSPNGYIYLGYIVVTIAEIWFITYYRRSLSRDMLFRRNRRVGSNLNLKNALRVSYKLIRSKILRELLEWWLIIFY
ncbi:hypothetical protein H311_01985 [Anncaliia algerae PRA109]|nr:hypothetical protein H311_01985 [Anncaliia algerae PRA109]